ncbi:hypothetical protein FXN61_31355 [Lentzea sp. PSKA42]|uniref:Uncharacterized protein n=1 Tax=Lentzea indica TaxID=2604800 RepID=A0ABX1FQF7_9PSEU|nr:hypothetical protein [Lentzea indica]NKE61039.1 hypothetical protein [Lentzea indica]
MSEQDDDRVWIHLPGGPAVPVRGGSPLEAAFSSSDPGEKMSWSLGLLGDFLWRNLPECRPFFAERLKHEIDEAIEQDRELHAVWPLEIACDVLWYPLIRPALDADPMDEELVARLLRIVREAWALEPPPWEDTRYGLRVYVLENLDVPEHISVVERLDPVLHQVIRNEIGTI